MSDADKDYYSFEEVLRDLDMEEDQLKKLVSAGEIRAFRDKNTMRFKAEDIARLRGGEDDVELDLDDELDLDLDLDLDDDAGAELELADDDEPLLDLEDDAGDELVLEDDDALGRGLGGDLEEVDLAADSGSRRSRAGAAGAAAGAAAGGSASRKELRSKRKVGAEARAAAEAQEQASEGPLVMGLLAVGAVVLLLASFTVFSAVAGHSNPTNSWIVNFFS